MSITRRDQEFREQPSLFDSPIMAQAISPGQARNSDKPVPLMEQERQLSRVRSSIGELIVEFFRSHSAGDEFCSTELHGFVQSHAQIAPGSADRVMRDLRKSGLINYTLISRSQSRYRVEALK